MECALAQNDSNAKYFSTQLSHHSHNVMLPKPKPCHVAPLAQISINLKMRVGPTHRVDPLGHVNNTQLSQTWATWSPEGFQHAVQILNPLPNPSSKTEGLCTFSPTCGICTNSCAMPHATCLHFTLSHTTLSRVADSQGYDMAGWRGVGQTLRESHN